MRQLDQVDRYLKLLPAWSANFSSFALAFYNNLLARAECVIYALEFRSCFASRNCVTACEPLARRQRDAHRGRRHQLPRKLDPFGLVRLDLGRDCCRSFFLLASNLTSCSISAPND